MEVELLPTFAVSPTAQRKNPAITKFIGKSTLTRSIKKKEGQPKVALCKIEVINKVAPALVLIIKPAWTARFRNWQSEAQLPGLLGSFDSILCSEAEPRAWLET